MRARWITVIGLGTGVAAGLLMAANLVLGDLNQDEGWYLYATRLVTLGQWPYADFAFTQGPVMPVVYSWIQPWLQTGGLAAGRLFTALLGLLCAVMAGALAANLTSPPLRRAAALLTVILILVNVYQSYFFTVVKTYALTADFLVAGFLALGLAMARASRLAALLAGMLLVLAAGTRSSAGLVLAVVLAGCWLARRRWPVTLWLYTTLGAVVMAGVGILPFVAAAPDNFWFFVMQYHTLRSVGGLGPALVYKAGFLSRLWQAYAVAASLGLAVLLARWFWRPPPPTPAPNWPAPAGFLTLLLWLSVAAVTGAHLLAPFPYDDYQVFVYPLLAVGVAVMSVRTAARLGDRGVLWLVSTIWFLALAAAGSSPINQEWFLQGRDRIWWRVKDRPALVKFQRAAAYLHTLAKPGELILTQDPYLAVEAGLTLPRGLEMGQFSYFPELTRDQAQRRHVLNREMLVELLQTCPAPVAALSGYAFAMESPRVTPVPPRPAARFREIVAERYEPVCEIPYFGQAATTLRIYKKKSER